jgi:hypothetical protein
MSLTPSLATAMDLPTVNCGCYLHLLPNRRGWRVDSDLAQGGSEGNPKVSLG